MAGEEVGPLRVIGRDPLERHRPDPKATKLDAGPKSLGGGTELICHLEVEVISVSHGRDRRSDQPACRHKIATGFVCLPAGREEPERRRTSPLLGK